MSVYFDTSVFIAAMVEEETHHAAALNFLAEAVDGFTSTHTLAESFAVLTGGRLNFQLTPEEATELIHANLLGRSQVIALGMPDYRQAMKESQRVGARGGAIFDMLHLQAARKQGARRILTVHVRHFQVFAPDLKHIISLP